MFIGTYYHTLDEKKRVAVPKAFRSQLESGSVTTYGLDGCLFIFTADSWSKLTDKLQSLPLTNKAARDFLRLLTFNATPLELDTYGRMLLPDNLKALVGITKEVVFAGALTRVEIWDKARYHAYIDGLNSQTGELENTLAELGI
ncbi:MAG: division/cell wall cluster transcriptional repressor MraZ [bacterium]|nr:division/cell wall cluster transcriptional repressor MraZ [Candidatus Microgenomates bacterium CPR3]MCQ3944559.1 division/cell wall cluster transcriptional repressor MraZ [bacterium]RIK51605.1 MAG: division/cell wall cluster transcriptional repressor MraZ [Candidatus Microgenomates bacterium]